MDECYRAVRAILPSRRTFFEHLRALLQYLPFDGWDHLMAFMLDALEPLARLSEEVSLPGYPLKAGQFKSFTSRLIRPKERQ